MVDPVLQLAGLGQVGNEHQLAGLIRQRLGRQLNPATVSQGDLVTVILTGFEAAGNDLAPGEAFQWLSQQRQGGRVCTGDQPSPSSSSTPVGSAVKMA